jgi:hypothetical protein
MIPSGSGCIVSFKSDEFGEGHRGLHLRNAKAVRRLLEPGADKSGGSPHENRNV